MERPSTYDRYMEPCPFCDTKVVVKRGVDHERMEDEVTIYCTKCNVLMRGTDIREVAKRWNARAGDDARKKNREIIESLEKALEHLTEGKAVLAYQAIKDAINA